MQDYLDYKAGAATPNATTLGTCSLIAADTCGQPGQYA
jgi:hypothetical protein